MSVDTQLATIQQRKDEKPYRRRVCKWVYDPDLDCWDTQCNNAFMLNDGTPADNNMNYCPYCGHELCF